MSRSLPQSVSLIVIEFASSSVQIGAVTGSFPLRLPTPVLSPVSIDVVAGVDGCRDDMMDCIPPLDCFSTVLENVVWTCNGCEVADGVLSFAFISVFSALLCFFRETEGAAFVTIALRLLFAAESNQKCRI